MATAQEGPLSQCPRCPIERRGVRTLAAVLLLPLLGGGGLALAQQRHGAPPGLASLLQLGEPIVAADRRLRQQGWQPAPPARPAAVDRERSGSSLASLSGCAGTGLGYCRFDYRRGGSRLAVITVPAATGSLVGPKVLRWMDEASGQLWGLCQSDSSVELVPCTPGKPDN